MLGIEYQQILEIISFWGYPLMLLLMIIEGPIVTLGAAFMASMGFFNVFIVLLLSIFGDIVGDVILYYIGFFTKRGLIPKQRKFLKSNTGVVRTIKNSFEKKGAQIIFFTKATTGLCYITFILAGMIKLDFKKFILFSVLGGLVWNSFVVILGYYFGWIAEEIEKYIKFSGWIIFFLAVLIMISIIIYKKTTALKKLKPLKK
jgi:membrane protein DedA with SNARE-associated domain